MKANQGLVLDAGVFLALEKGDPLVVELVRLWVRNRTPLRTSAAVVAQIWRGGSGRQVPVTYLLSHMEIVDLTYPVARVIGRMLGLSRTRDPVDAHVVLLARERGWPVLTSDPGDLLRIDPDLTVETV